MSSRRTYRVKDVARIAGISVRTLHYYDEIGLLPPRGRSAAGYRFYDDEDLLRLQEILIGRELGLSLEAIKKSLDDEQHDRETALVRHRAELIQRAAKTEEMIRAVDSALAAIRGEVEEDMEMNKLFNGFDPSKYEVEAHERWGETPAFQTAAKRTAGYTDEDWARMHAEQSAIYEAVAAAIAKGLGAESTEAMAIAERHRLLIDRWFYPCSHAQHASLAGLYEGDERFAANMNRFGEGVTEFLVRAIRANTAEPLGE